MAKFCGKCGLPLESDGSCRLCDEMEPAQTALEIDNAAPLLSGTYTAPQAAPSAAAQPVSPAAAVTPAAPIKKKKPLLPILIVILVVLLLLGGGVFAAFHFHLFGLGQTPEATAPATATAQTAAPTAPDTTAPLPASSADSVSSDIIPEAVFEIFD